MAQYQAIRMYQCAHNIAWYQCMACMHMVLMHVTLYGMVYVCTNAYMHLSLWHGKNACLTTEWYQYILYEAIYVYHK